jgi:hypothetical protein
MLWRELGWRLLGLAAIGRLANVWHRLGRWALAEVPFRSLAIGLQFGGVGAGHVVGQIDDPAVAHSVGPIIVGVRVLGRPDLAASDFGALDEPGAAGMAETPVLHDMGCFVRHQLEVMLALAVAQSDPLALGVGPSPYRRSGGSPGSAGIDPDARHRLAEPVLQPRTYGRRQRMTDPRPRHLDPLRRFVVGGMRVVSGGRVRERLRLGSSCFGRLGPRGLRFRQPPDTARRPGINDPNRHRTQAVRTARVGGFVRRFCVSVPRRIGMGYRGGADMLLGFPLKRRGHRAYRAGLALVPGRAPHPPLGAGVDNGLRRHGAKATAAAGISGRVRRHRPDAVSGRR